MFTGVRLRQFRSYKDQAFELENGVNIVVGPNASGKTNMLESLYALAQGKSFRARDKDLIMLGSEWTGVEGDLTHGRRSLRVKAAGETVTKQISVNDTKYRRLPAEKKLPVVLFVPDHLQLLTGSPQRRRSYLDTLISQLYPARAPTFSRYAKALQQRNALLKQSSIDTDQLFVWNIKLAELGAHIHTWRQQLIGKLNEQASEAYSQLTDKQHTVSFQYVDSIEGKDYQSELTKSLESPTDRRAGFTTKGPHRDDMIVLLDKKNSASTASRGETRTLVLVAKIVELLLMETATNTRPLLLFDDVFSELDGSRRRQLANRVKDYQTIITTTDADAVVEHFSKEDQHTIALS